MAEIKKGYRRKNYFVDRKFQTGFILKFCSVVAIGGVVTIAVLYFLAMRSTTVSIINSRVVAVKTSDFLLPILLQTILIVMIVVSLATIVLTLLVSHRIAGPIYRLKNVLELLGDGDFSSDFRIRRLDQFQEVADTLNATVKKIRQNLNSMKGSFRSLKDGLDRFSETDVAEYRRSLLNELKRLSQELHKTVGYFKS